MIHQVHPGGVPPLVVVLRGDLEARWVEEIVDADAGEQARDWEEESQDAGAVQRMIMTFLDFYPNI